ncbi:AKAP7 2'5' RNA ligase-like domain-containing protein [Cladorrhinum sp. PSN259]|nr:AKAP7 2'5' RNA ligase-like domain-containing protein [Cladorrhinum sp. PSN259]
MPPKPSIPTTTGTSRPSPPTHFLCIPLVTSASRPKLAASISAFKDDVCSPDTSSSVAFPEDAIRPVGTLHLTLGVMSFASIGDNGQEGNSISSEEKEKSLERAKQLLRGLRLRDIWRAACREAEERTRMLKGAANEVVQGEEEEEEEDIKITLKGLASMQPPNKTAVLYAPPVDPHGRLYGFCERVRDVFREGGVMGDDGGRPLLLHATVVNTIYVKGNKAQKGKRGGKGGRGGGRRGGRERLTFDAMGIIDRYEQHIWMQGVRLEGVAICKMGAKKVLNEHGEETGDEKSPDVVPMFGPSPKASPSTSKHTPATKVSRNEKTMSPPEKRRPVASSSSSSTASPRPTRQQQQQQQHHPRSSSLVATHRNNTITPPRRAAISRGSSPSPPLQKPTAPSSSSSSLLRPTSPHPSQPAITAASTALRQKDLRIQSLERELGIMESELTREALEKESSATTTHLQAKCAALEKKLAEQQEAINLITKSESILLRRSNQEILRRDEEIRELRSQVRGLKEWVSNSTRSDECTQTSDEVFGEGMAKLGNGLQNWVLVNFRRNKVDLSNTPEGVIAELGRLVPMHKDLVSTSKIHLLQSVVSRLLVELVFDTYFAGLPKEEARQLTEAETLLASYGASPEPINQWRSMTLTILRKDGNEKLQTKTTNLVGTIVSRVNELLDAMTATKSNDNRDQGLRALISSAIDLSRLLSTQRAVFNVMMPEILPHQRIVFDAETMEDIGGEDEDSLLEREVCCVTFPGIIKRGDSSGGHMQYRNVISKARVLCSPE